MAVAGLLVLPCAQECSAQDATLARVWEQYARQTIPPSKAIPLSKEDAIRKQWEYYIQKALVAETELRPGRTIGNDTAIAGFMEKSGWRHRATSYELYFSSSRELARSIHGLALASGDIDKTMPLERFEKGVRGFHYTMDQLCRWIDAVLCGDLPTQTSEERRFILWLVEDRVVKVINGKAVPAGTIHHVLGASPGKKRSFAATLMHERLHVLWDEDPAFADNAKKKWAALTDAEKADIRKTLAAYAQSNEAQLMEEWTIYQAENMPETKRKQLIGL
jgi:hypothetical protein